MARQLTDHEMDMQQEAAQAYEDEIADIEVCGVRGCREPVKDEHGERGDHFPYCSRACHDHDLHDSRDAYMQGVMVNEADVDGGF